MCGIGGIYLPDGVKVCKATAPSLVNLFRFLEDRGGHASGFSLKTTNEDQIEVHKAAINSNTFSLLLKNGLPRKMYKIRSVLLHTRYSTHGSVQNNGNNHPITTNGIVLTHNGVLRNDVEIFDTLGTGRFNEVDSEAINASLRLKSPSWMIDNIRGTMSVAWIDTQDPEQVHLLTNGQNPLYIARLWNGAVVWASTRSHLVDAFGDGFTGLMDDASGFHAIPFKQYTLGRDGKIRSDFISKQRGTPMIGWADEEWRRF